MGDFPVEPKKKKLIRAADLFCGAGGTAQGLLLAANEINADLSLVAVNHWQIAIDTHSLNHPYAQHLCCGLDSVDPRKLVPGGRLDVLCASPECTHHSNARGGRPMNDQSRSSAWHILRFAEAVYCDSILCENVPEFLHWGPLGANGRPLKSKRGQLFRQFISSLEALGYRVEHKVLNSADYGEPTVRRRLFILARRGNKPIHWPLPTHVAPDHLQTEALFPDPRKPWRTAREIINWSAPSTSIFERKKPLAEKTLRRIELGLSRFNGLEIDLVRCLRQNLRPWVLVQKQQAVTNDRDLVNGIDPFVLPHPRKHDLPHSVDRPLRTVTASSCDLSVVRPFLVPQFGEREGQAPRTHSVDAPLPAVTSHGAGALVQPMMKSRSGFRLAPPAGSQPRVLYFPIGDEEQASAAAALHPDCFLFRLDIDLRMLQPRELARAQGFDDGYRFTGTQEDQVKQIGNAVTPGLARLLLLSVLTPAAAASPMAA
jgi:DNA (cytosine-5)-methyltransferase 1